MEPVWDVQRLRNNIYKAQATTMVPCWRCFALPRCVQPSLRCLLATSFLFAMRPDQEHQIGNQKKTDDDYFHSDHSLNLSNHLDANHHRSLVFPAHRVSSLESCCCCCCSRPWISQDDRHLLGHNSRRWVCSGHSP